MQFAALGDLYLGAEQFPNGLSERLADIATIGQDALNGLQISRATLQGQQCALAVCHIGGGNGNGVRQALGIDRCTFSFARVSFRQ